MVSGCRWPTLHAHSDVTARKTQPHRGAGLQPDPAEGRSPSTLPSFSPDQGSPPPCRASSVVCTPRGHRWSSWPSPHIHGLALRGSDLCCCPHLPLQEDASSEPRAPPALQSISMSAGPPLLLCRLVLSSATGQTPTHPSHADQLQEPPTLVLQRQPSPALPAHRSSTW